MELENSTIAFAVLGAVHAVLGSAHAGHYLYEKFIKHKNKPFIDATNWVAPRPKQTILDFYIRLSPLIAASCIVLFIIFGVIWLEGKNTELQAAKAELSRLRESSSLNEPHFELSVGGMILSTWGGDSTRFQLTTTVYNHGSASSTHGWSLHIASLGQQYEAKYFPGQSPIGRSYKNESADTSINIHPLEKGAEITCHVFFLLQGVPQTMILSAMTNASEPISMSLSVRDKNDKVWKTPVDVVKLSQQMSFHSTNGTVE